VPVGVKVVGTDQFHRVARELKAAGRGDLAKDMTKAMRRAADPAKQDMQSSVRGLATTNTRRRGGASARGVRAAHALRGRSRAKLSERAKQKAFRQSGLRDTVARSVRAQATAGGRSASVRIRAARSQMPPGQAKLPALMNRGKWRHPYFGRDPWTTQTVTPGWFDRPAKKHGPKVRDAAFAVVLQTINKLGQ
jgi:hypothetical protein